MQEYSKLVMRADLGYQTGSEKYQEICDIKADEKSDPFLYCFHSKFISNLEKKYNQMCRSDQIGLSFYLESNESVDCVAKKTGLTKQSVCPSNARSTLKKEMFDYNPFQNKFYEGLLDNVTKRDSEVIGKLSQKNFNEMLVYLKPKISKLLKSTDVSELDHISKEQFIAYLKNKIHPIEKESYLIKEINRHISLGYSQKEIKSLLGVSNDTIQKVRKHDTHEKKEKNLAFKVKNLLEKDYLVSEIENILGIENSQLNQIKNNL